MVETAIILAGGLGTRLKETVPNLPKPMAPINGRPFLEYQMDYWINQGINKFILSVGHLNNVIIDHFGYKYKNTILEYSIEDFPLGTGGGLMMALQNQIEPVLVVNGDTFFEVDLKVLYSFHFTNKSKFTLSLHRVDQSKRYLGIEVQNNGKILKLNNSNSNAQSGQLVNGGVYIVEPLIKNTLNYKTEEKISLEDDILSRLLHDGVSLYGKEFTGKFIDIGIPEDYYRAQEVI